jgi:hypothetical protein
VSDPVAESLGVDDDEVFASGVREELEDAEAEAVRQPVARASIGTALNQKA